MARLLEAGGPPPGGVPMAMVTAGSAVHATRAVPGLLSGDVLRAVHVPATSPFDEIVARLETLRPVMLQSYPSVLRRLAAARRDGRLTITPMSVTATGETFPADLRAEVAEAFGVPVADQFGSSEGLVGVSPPGADGIVLADDLAVVELVDARDRPVPPGVPSDAVLVTGLVNRAQPLVRFRIEDRMVRLPGPAGTPWTVVRVEGRSDDVLDFDGRVLHPLVVRTVLAQRPDVAEYRVRQAADGLDVDVVAAGEPDVASVAAGLRAAVAAAGLPDLEVRVRVVDGLRGDPGSGKVRRFVPL
jgi:phenylacetate-CoA ligase